MPSVRYLIPSPTSPSLEAPVSMTENMRLNSVGAKTVLLHAVGDRKGFGHLTAVLDSRLHAIMGLLHHGDTLLWVSILGHGLPPTFSTDSVEGLGQVDAGGAHVNVLLLALFLQLPCSERHVDGPALSGRRPWSRYVVRRFRRILARSRPAMESKDVLRWLSQARMAIPFPLIQGCDGGIFEPQGNAWSLVAT